MASANLQLSYKQDIWDVKCTVSEISASGNYREISLKLEVRTKDFSSGRDGGYHVNCDEGGDVEERSCVVPGSSQSRFILYDEIFDVYVAPGQTYADISFDFEIHFWSSSANATRSLSGSIGRITGLSIISEVTISSAKDIYFGDRVSITWTPLTSTFAYKLKFVLGEREWTTGILTPNTTSAYTYSDLTIPVEEAVNIPNSRSGTMSVTITQYKNSSASETVGSSVTKNFTVTLRDNVVPTISSASASLDNSMNPTVASWGVGLAGYSKINITAFADGIYGSTIESFTICSSESNESIVTKYGTSINYTSDTIISPGNKSYIITCTDSRGMTSAEVATDLISILPYTKPKMLSLSTTKDECGTADTEDDRMVVTATWEYDPINGHNYANGAVYYKESHASSWTKHAGVVNYNEPFKLSSLQLDDEKSYNIQVVVTDAVGESDDKSSFSSTTQVLLDFRAGGKGLGIGKICEQDGMEVSMNATFYNDVFVQRDSEKYDIETYIKMLSRAVLNEQKNALLRDIYPIGSIYISVSNTNPATLFGGTWERIKDRFLFAAIDESDLNDVTDPDDPGRRYLLGKMDGEKEHILTIDEMPRHRHWNAARPDYASPSTHDNGTAGTHPGAVMVSDEDEKNTLPYTDYEGSSLPHNNMPPYLAVYMWKRTG